MSSSAEQIFSTVSESISTCVELLDGFADKTIQPYYNPWPSVDFHDKSQLYADLTKAYEIVRLASSVEKGVKVSVSPETPDKLAPQ